MASIALRPDPLPHGASGLIEYQTSRPYPWAEVILSSPSGGVLQVSYHKLSEGDTTFVPGATPSWDGTGGANGSLRLFDHGTNGRQRTLAKGAFKYEA